MAPRLLSLVVLVVLLAAAPFAARAQIASPHAHEIPDWFAQTFLDFRDDVRDAARQGKRLMVYFGQDGCPYCAALFKTNFTQPRLVEKTRRLLMPIAINIWGDRELTWLDGKTMSEKEFARLLKVQFTPTLLFFDEKGEIVVRLNGYYPPHRLDAVIDYVGGRMESKFPFAEYMRSAVREVASETLHEQPFLMNKPYDLRRASGSKPLAVLFESPFCSGCDEMHQEGFARAEVMAQLARFDVARVSLLEAGELVTPQGERLRADEWARALKIAYTPSIVFFDAKGREVFRTEAYVRPFHLAGSFEYVGSGAYAREPSFQRFLQAKAEQLRERGQAVELWK